MTDDQRLLRPLLSTIRGDLRSAPLRFPMPESRSATCRSQFAMLRYGSSRRISGLDENYVASVLPVIDPTSLLESPHGPLPRNGGQGRHQAGTSTSRTAIVRGIPLAARVARQPAIASLRLSNASASVRPWETQPGMAGHSATITPVSSGSSVTSSFMLRSYRGCEADGNASDDTGAAYPVISRYPAPLIG